ncbi:hypothetical protein MCOR25_006407 [Pyricularia grisea]|nr:hypothetical protein MCOR25_006407 [Pyricularia grisea]
MATDVEQANVGPLRRSSSGEKEEPKRGLTPPGDHHDSIYTGTLADAHYEGKPTEEELATLRRVAGGVPLVAYLLCLVEFCERASYYGCVQIYGNYVNRPMPTGGDGWGAPPAGTQQTAGALGMGQSVSTSVTQSVSLLAYGLPLITGWLADTKTGRFNQIWWGVFVMGIGHVILVASGAKDLLANGNAKIPFFIGIYTIAIGSAMFKPNVSPLLLDQMTSHVPKVKTLKSGERVIEDPEHSVERVMLWFYLMINVGGFMAVATSYSEKYVGWWLSFLLPLILYMPLPFVLMYLKPRLVMHPPGGSDLANIFRVLGYCMRGGGIFRIGRKGWWNAAKPSVIAANGGSETRWNDQFIEDVKRTFQATGMFCFFPIQFINDNGLGSAPGLTSTMMVTNGVPNDLLSNMNSLIIIIGAPILNYGFYPLLRSAKIHYGPVARITTGFFISTLGGIGYTVLQYYVYQMNPCGWYGGSDPRCVDNGLVSDISVWWLALPYALGGFSELFINVPAYGIAYSRAPVNMRGLVSAINLFNTAIAYIINLACSPIVQDPYLVWDFGGPAIAGGIVTVIFWFLFRHIDKEEYVLSTQAEELQEHHDSTGTGKFIEPNKLNASSNLPAPIADNEQYGISQKQ